MLFSLVKKKKNCLILGRSSSVIIVVQQLHYPHTFPKISDSICVLHLSQRETEDFRKSQPSFLGSSVFVVWIYADWESLNSVALHKVSTLWSCHDIGNKGLNSLTSICLTTWQNSCTQAGCRPGAAGEMGAYRWHVGSQSAAKGSLRDNQSHSAKGLKSLTRLTSMYASAAGTTGL